MKKIHYLFVIFVMGFCLFCACGRSRSDQRTQMTGEMTVLYTIEGVREADSHAMVFWQDFLYLAKGKEKQIVRYSRKGECEDFARLDEQENLVDLEVSDSDGLMVLCAEGETGQLYLKTLSSEGKVLKTQTYDAQTIEKDISNTKTEWSIVLSEYGIDVSEVRCFRRSEECIVCALYHSSQHSVEVIEIKFVLEKAQGNLLDSALANGRETDADVQKQELLFVLTDMYSVQEHIAGFNRNQELYKIKAKPFRLPDEETQMKTVITNDKTVDLVQISGIWDYRVYASKHYLADIRGYLKESSMVKEEDFLPLVVECFRYEDELYALPGRFSISTLLAPTEMTKGKTSWTVEEFLSLLEEYPNALATDSVEATKGKILRDALYRGIADFVDFEMGEARFDSDSFRNILIRIQSLPLVPSAKSGMEKLQDGEVALLDFYEIRNARDFADAEMKSGMEMSIIGYPVSTESKGGGSLIAFSDIVGISALSGNKKEAFVFVEQCLSMVSQKKGNGFPTNMQAFEEYLQLETEEDFEEYYKDNYYYRVISDEQVDKVRRACETATFYNGQEMEVLSIISEESQSYFCGDKPVEEVCRLIQNRVQLLLSE